MLDEPGFYNTKIVASNDLDEYSIKKLKDNGAKIDIWGVGTKLITSYDQPALGGVYKLSKLENAYKIKLSEESNKTSIPGSLQIRRYYDKQNIVADIIYDENIGMTDIDCSAILLNSTSTEVMHHHKDSKNILVPIFNKGNLVYEEPNIRDIRNKAKNELDFFLQQHQNQAYPVSLEKKLFHLRKEMINELRQDAKSEIDLKKTSQPESKTSAITFRKKTQLQQFASPSNTLILTLRLNTKLRLLLELDSSVDSLCFIKNQLPVRTLKSGRLI